MIDWDQLTLPEVLFRGLDDLEGNDLVTTLFEAADLEYITFKQQ